MVIDDDDDDDDSDGDGDFVNENWAEVALNQWPHAPESIALPTEPTGWQVGPSVQFNSNEPASCRVASDSRPHEPLVQVINDPVQRFCEDHTMSLESSVH